LDKQDITLVKNTDPFYCETVPNLSDKWTTTARGQVTHYFHPIVGSTKDIIDHKNSLPVTVVNGTKDGPTLLIIAGEHGNEYENIAALQETLRGLDPKQINGRVVGINCCSVDSYLHDMRVSKSDGLNLARCYPGLPNGKLTERIAFTLQRDFISQPEPYRPVCLIPLHTFGPSLIGATLSGYNIYPDEPELTQKQHEMSLASGLPLVWGHEFDALSAANTPLGHDNNGRTALYAAYLAGIPATYWETTWGMQGEEEYKRGLLRIMKYFNLLKGDPKKSSPRSEIKSVGHGSGNMASHNHAPCNGLWRPLVRVWDEVEAGDRLGEIRNLHGEVLGEILALKSGLVISTKRIQRIDKGLSCTIVL
tara:strand:- start:62 stop:1153 length:1092 start_codon:yes stop_codon:yes gene_type:complete